MRKIIEVSGDGFDSFLGEKITVYCGVYIYTGILSGVNDLFLKLDEAKIVYDTGPHGSNEWADAEKFNGSWYVMINAIESFGDFK